MKTIQRLIALGCILLAGILAATPLLAAATQPAEKEAGEFINPGWKAAGLYRSGMVWVPADPSRRPKNGWPIVFVFHGHGGADRSSMRGFAIEKSWPEAIVIYLKGLPTRGVLTDPEGNKPGWDMRTEPENNRDIALFDVVLDWAIKEQHGDPSRVYSTGHSNGGGFTYTLWAYRGDKLAGVAPSSAALSVAGGRDMLKPKPAMIIGGQDDPLVKFEWQNAMMNFAKKLDQCAGDGKPWAPGGKDALWYDSPTGNPVVTIIHNRGHRMAENAGASIAAFFKQLAK